MAINFVELGNSLGDAVKNIAQTSAKATAKANAISAQAQSAQGSFNQASANQANMLNDQSIANQYGFNSAMMQNANEYNTEAWNTAASWNERMWRKQAEFNAEQAQLNREFNAAEAQKLRDWQEYMSNSSYQRAMADMSKAGLNPILAYSQGGAGIPGGAAGTGTAASVGGAQMSSASAQMASGGLLGANSASEGNYMGIAENMGTTLALLGAVFGGLSSAFEASGGLGDVGANMISEVTDALMGKGDYEGSWWDKATDKMADWFTDGEYSRNKNTAKQTKPVVVDSRGSKKK